MDICRADGEPSKHEVRHQQHPGANGIWTTAEISSSVSSQGSSEANGVVRSWGVPRVGSTHHVAAPGSECALGGAREGFRQLSSSCPLELSEEDPRRVPLGGRSTESLGSCNSLPRASVPLPFKDSQATLTPTPCSAEQPLLAKKLNPLSPPGSVLRSSKSPRPPPSEAIHWGHLKEVVSGWGQSRPGGSSWEPLFSG